MAMFWCGAPESAVRAVREGERSVALHSLPPTEAEILSLSNALATSATIEELWIFDCVLSDAQVRVLAEGLVECQAIRCAGFTKTTLGLDGTRAISELVRTGVLDSFFIIQGGITDVSVAPIADAINLSKSLRVLGLSDNHISDTGAVLLAEAIKVSESLNKVDLTGNQISSSGVRALCEAIPFSVTLNRRCVGLALNPGVTPADLSAVDAALRLPRLAYCEARAFMAASALGKAVEQQGHTAHAQPPRSTPARVFIEACGDRGVLRKIVAMLVGE